MTVARYQLSLRSFVLLVTVACILLGWYINEIRWRNQELEVKRDVARLGGRIRSGEMGIVFFAVEDLSLAGTEVRDSDLEKLRKLRHPFRIDLSKTGISDKGLEYLKEMPSLRHLDLTQTLVSADGVSALQKRLPSCAIRF